MLNLVKTLFPTAQTEGQEQASQGEEKLPAPPPPPQEEGEKENACAAFLEAHEKRAKRR